MPWTPPLTGIPYPCPLCGETIRAVRDYGTQEVILINAYPDPWGTVIPWPAADLNSVAEARVLAVPPAGEPAWSIHPCR